MSEARAEGRQSKRATATDREVGFRLRLRRKELGLSQEKIGAAVGVSFQQIQKYENGTNRIGAGRLKEIGRVLSVPVTYFFDDLADDDAAPSTVVLQKPGAMELLKLYAKIDSPVLARAVVDLARTLSQTKRNGAHVTLNG